MSYKITNNIILSLILILGFYLCIIGGYGSDEDTLPMIGTFIGFTDGRFMTSRFTGYPVAEFIIGFFSYNFGSYLINIIVFLSFVIGSVFFYISFENNKGKDHIILFLVLLLSNPILYFENLEPMDYSLAFLFFSLGFYFLKINRIEFSVIFFGICIGTRINFAPFIVLAIYFNHFNFIENNFRKLSLIICSLFIGCLFYLPVWINSGLGFDWLRAGRPESSFVGYLARFIYKLIISFGIIQTVLLFFLIKRNLHRIIKIQNFKLILFLILTNLLIFLYIPAEKSYLQPMIIFSYYILYQSVKTKHIYFIIIINFMTWFINFDLIKVDYRFSGKCDPVQAIGAKFEPKFINGYFKEFYNTRDNIRCWIDVESEIGKKILTGKALKN